MSFYLLKDLHNVTLSHIYIDTFKQSDLTGTFVSPYVLDSYRNRICNDLFKKKAHTTLRKTDISFCIPFTLCICVIKNEGVFYLLS